MYAKLYVSMYDGTLATRGPWEALVTFQQLLVLADRFGIVDMTHEAISRRTTVPEDIIRKGITVLECNDEMSRRPDANGRRIVRLADHRDWGWEIVNYEHYRSIRSAEERRDKNRQYMKEYRAKKAKPEAGEVIERIPLKDGTEFDVRESLVAELDRSYPNVEPKQTLREIRAWCISNTAKLKTRQGVKRFINGWFAREQAKHGRP